ncbi:TadE/TadG family type IV pilus assembly protein [Noviherbaspirillum denitrificans]|uniref:TadE-like domain-containing protein n=1 Tax=Noviherbaspirillum denitrificans TaxID=1968433 RepID=A0A254T8W7_9BURK|nr:TadE/TadG family type IV pilus assembly protein [Noviherbaspirillum denitrificans]OWW19101.1 hypothetical protein AYR66_05955 [Noviherbaspirillum denitrificans]
MEFAIVVILMMLLVAAVIGFGRAFWYADALTKATRDGARLMSTWPSATIASEGMSAAQDLVVATANAAWISPQLADANVIIECMDATYSVVACTDGTAPVNVRARITGHTFTIAELFPFIGIADALNESTTSFTPHTTMRYML